MKSIRTRLVLSLCIAVVFAGCRPPHLNPPPHPQRIVSLKPNLTEMLFAIGAGDRVVGVTTHCLWPEAATQLPKVGDYAFPDLERIMAQQPDLVVTNKESGSPRFVAVLENAGIPVLILETRTVAQIYAAIETLGSVLQVPQQARALNANLQSRFAKLRANNHQVPKRALVVIQRQPLIVLGTHSFINELLEIAGASNVVPLAGAAYPKVSMEEVLAWAPEVIFDIDPTSSLSQWTAFRSLPAVQKGQIYFLSPSLLLPGPRIAAAAQMMARALR